jgi:hypothetical protein
MAMKQLNSERRLFVDMEEIALRENVTRCFHSVQRHGPPVLWQQEPWEKHAGMTASVIFDEEEKLFKCWYMAGFYAPETMHVHCLAVSEDGIHWRRPNLGRHEALGSTANNIVIPAAYHDGMDHFETVLKDPLESDANRRYKAIGWSSYDWDGPLSGIYTGTSSDGIDWQFTPRPVFAQHPRPGTDDVGPIGDAQAMMVDTRKRRYVAFLRGAGPDSMWRVTSESEDFVHWTPPRRILYILNEEESLYNNSGFVYGAQYLGFLSHFDRRAATQSQSVQLLTSRDGDDWMRAPATEPIVPLGEIGEWDRFQIMLTGAPPIVVGDRLYIYWRGTSRRHNKVKSEFEPWIDADQDRTTMSIGLGTLRLDGFASIDGSYNGGTITTVPYEVASADLHVNVKADHGALAAELLDESFDPIPGFGREDCVPVAADSVDATLCWQGAKKLPLDQLGKPVRIRFHLVNARLYSFWVA